MFKMVIVRITAVVIKLIVILIVDLFEELHVLIIITLEDMDTSTKANSLSKLVSDFDFIAKLLKPTWASLFL